MALNASAAGAVTVPTRDQWSFTVILVVSTLVLLPVALVAQALMLEWRSWFPGAESEKSLFGGVQAAVYTFVSQLI